jgi:putative radical SAM enzyme (TIGR03279 family)
MVEASVVNKNELEYSRQTDPNAQKDIKFVSGPAYISSVPTWSLAYELELKVGDKILEINNEKLRDFFDFQYHFEQSDFVTLVVQREIAKGKFEEFEIELEKDIGDTLGCEFVTPLFNGVQECANDCPFCFIENQPFNETRESLQLRDDDFRLSYLHGSYVTLTNLSFSDRKRIETLRPGPLYVSVHATEPEIRNKMLGRKKSIAIVEELKWLASLDIPVHTQIVLCPEMNDAEHLLKTIQDLYELKDKPVQSLAIVPVGLTKYHRRGLRRFTLDEALETISLVENWEKQDPKNRDKFVFLSDEFFLMTHNEVPDKKYYGDYPILEDGVGMTRLFLDDVDKELAKIKKQKFAKSFKITWVNGTISQHALRKVARKFEDKFENLILEPFCIESDFWGTTNVTGLLTGKDIIKKVQEHSKDLGDLVLIPSVMLKEGFDIFLDDMHIDELAQALNITCKKAWGAKEILDLLLANCTDS